MASNSLRLEWVRKPLGKASVTLTWPGWNHVLYSAPFRCFFVFILSTVLKSYAGASFEIIRLFDFLNPIEMPGCGISGTIIPQVIKNVPAVSVSSGNMDKNCSPTDVVLYRINFHTESLVDLWAPKIDMEHMARSCSGHLDEVMSYLSVHHPTSR